MPMFRHKPTFAIMLRESLLVIVGAVLIWRGIWILLDLIDLRFFGGSHGWSSTAGIVIGVMMVYFADRKLEDVV